jgi:hypothetical protein
MHDVWFENKDRAADLAFEYLNVLDVSRHHMMEMARANYGLYDGHVHEASDGSGGQRLSPLRYRDDTFVSENVCKSTVDAAMSLLANPTRVALATDGADFSVHKRARRLERFLEGVDRANNAEAKIRSIVRDGCIAPNGFLKICPDYERGIPRFERVLVDEIYVDEWACRTSPPKELFQRIYADRRRLAAMFPKHKDTIMTANAVGLPVSDGSQPARDSLVEVCEAYHCRRSRDSDDGVKMIALREGRDGGTVLSWEKWERDEPPFVWFCWTMPTIGFYGTPLMDEITGIQMRLHKDNKRWDAITDRIAFPTTFVPVQDADLMKKLRDGARIVPYRTAVPETIAPPTLPPDILQRHRYLEEQARRLVGLSDFAAFSQKPPDVRSGPGFREVNETQSQRFILQHKQIEDLKLAIARHTIATAKEMHASGKMGAGGPEVAWRSRNIARRIKWADVDMEADKYVMHTQPVSILSQTVSGRKDMVMEMFNAGLIPPEKATALLDIPDLEKENQLANAERADIEATIERLEEGEMVMPEPYQNLAMGLVDIKRNLLRIRNIGAGERAIEAHEAWLQAAEQMQAEQMQQQAAAMAPMQAGPGAEMEAAPAGPSDAELVASMGL